MSADSVDDLHFAEDALGALAHVALDVVQAAKRLAASPTSPARAEQLADKIALLRTVCGAIGRYCRPTCQANGVVDDCEAGDTCGCPCHSDTS